MGKLIRGTHPRFLDPVLFEDVQVALNGHNRPKYSKREIAFRGLMNCAYDGCTLTGDVQKQKYAYYRCTGHRGKCELPVSEKKTLPISWGAAQGTPGSGGGRLADYHDVT